MGGQQKKIGQKVRNEIMGFTVSHKPAGLDLMQNCDLPPPSKFFMGPDKTVILSMNKVCNIAGEEQDQDSKYFHGYAIKNSGDEDRDKMELLKALQASQTRAREAEKKATVLRKERDGLSIALLEEAMQLFACRQQVRLLEVQVLNLQSNEDGDDEETSVARILALILSLGIGVTTALACRYKF
ncbi:uncharacterized protein LOC130724138 [Lotus japonicus]|uniref:Uncharacterized protein n=1 Tax=Lotus japonicus TaxID=34305 RepID=I3S9Q9_LOTJA|nr:uncharacterized protein LOC130724138 [Lotus japonicus]AFK37001.1 unknown [Lotus japonicus]